MISDPEPLQEEQATANVQPVTAELSTPPSVAENVATAETPADTEDAIVRVSAPAVPGTVSATEQTVVSPVRSDSAASSAGSSDPTDAVRLENELARAIGSAGTSDTVAATLGTAPQNQVVPVGQPFVAKPLRIAIPDTAVVRLATPAPAIDLPIGGCYERESILAGHVHKSSSSGDCTIGAEDEDIFGLLEPLLALTMP
jgi:hypothetical protein